MKKFYLIILFAFLASFGSYITAAETWTKVTTDPGDWSGDYLIVYEDKAGSVAFDGSLTKLDVTSNIQPVTITNNQITTDVCKFYFTIEPAATAGTYAIKSASGRYIGRTSTGNGLSSNTSPTYTNTLSLTGGNISIQSSANMYLKYNTSDKRFRYYSSGQEAIQLYKKADANQVAAPTANHKSGTYNVAITVEFNSPEGTTINGFLNNETAIVSTSNFYSKELIAVGGEKTTYTFEVWTEYNKNSSEIVTYTYTIDPSYVPDSYILCTDIKYLTPGTKVIFVGSKTDGTACRVMTDFDGSIRNADATNVEVSNDGSTLNNIGNAVVFTVAYDGSATDNYKYSFYDSESNYLGSGTKDNSMTNQTAEGGIIPDKAKWSISLNAGKNYNATILAKEYYTNGNKKYPSLKYNSGTSPRFACYQSTSNVGSLRIYFNAKTSGVEKVSLNDKTAKVYGAAGNIVVEAEAAADVNVYNAAGMLVATQKVGAGRTNIALAKGFYVVRAGNTVTKVAVR